MAKLFPLTEFPWDGFGPTPRMYLDLACAWYCFSTWKRGSVVFLLDWPVFLIKKGVSSTQSLRPVQSDCAEISSLRMINSKTQGLGAMTMSFVEYIQLPQSGKLP